jgi:hypothetical protein
MDGNYATEESACRALDAALDQHRDQVEVVKEVVGQYLLPRPCSKDQRARIDRIVIPRRPLVEAGWTLGPFGIEVKRSGKKAGPTICQAMDYARALYVMPQDSSIPGHRIVLSWIFLFPLKEMGGDLSSIMMQHRIGRCWLSSHSLSFGGDGIWAINLRANGEYDAKPLASGQKVGSR